MAARELEIPYFLLGMGANILVGDRGFRGLVIRTRRGIEFLDDTAVKAGAGGDGFPDLIEATVDRGLGGLHHLRGDSEHGGRRDLAEPALSLPAAGARAHRASSRRLSKRARS